MQTSLITLHDHYLLLRLQRSCQRHCFPKNKNVVLLKPLIGRRFPWCRRYWLWPSILQQQPNDIGINCNWWSCKPTWDKVCRIPDSMEYSRFQESLQCHQFWERNTHHGMDIGSYSDKRHLKRKINFGQLECTRVYIFNQTKLPFESGIP